MCTHGSIQLNTERNIIYCADCGRDFAKLTRDLDETLVVSLTESVVLMTEPLDLNNPTATACVASFEDGRVKLLPIEPCARCGFSFSCEDGECHS
jgi:hypothetical protein